MSRLSLPAVLCFCFSEACLSCAPIHADPNIQRVSYLRRQYYCRSLKGLTSPRNRPDIHRRSRQCCCYLFGGSTISTQLSRHISRHPTLLWYSSTIGAPESWLVSLDLPGWPRSSQSTTPGQDLLLQSKYPPPSPPPPGRESVAKS